MCNPFPLMSKGEEEQANRESVLPSMPKGGTVGNIVINGKEGNRCRDRQRIAAEDSR